MVNQRFHICDSMNEGSEANKRTQEIQKTGTGNHDDAAPASELDEEDNADGSGTKSALLPWDPPSILSLTLFKYYLKMNQRF